MSTNRTANPSSTLKVGDRIRVLPGIPGAGRTGIVRGIRVDAVDVQLKGYAGWSCYTVAELEVVR